MIDNSWERTFLQLFVASRNVLPLYYGHYSQKSIHTSIRHGVQRMSDCVHRPLVDLFGHALQASLQVEKFDVQSTMKPRFLRHAIKPQKQSISMVIHLTPWSYTILCRNRNASCAIIKLDFPIFKIS